jgi:broad specificity phosphatase PhoE
MRRLIVIRHGQTEHNAQGRTISSTDPPLNEVGTRQADSLGGLLSEVRLARIVSSPKLRTRQTAQAVAGKQPTDVEIELDDRLLEIGLGSFEGLSIQEIKDRGLQEVFEIWRQGTPAQYPPGAETFEQAAERMTDLYENISPRDGETVVIVGHSHSLRILLATKVLGVPPQAHRRLRIDHAALTVVTWEDATPRLIVLNAYKNFRV